MWRPSTEWAGEDPGSRWSDLRAQEAHEKIILSLITQHIWDNQGIGLGLFSWYSESHLKKQKMSNLGLWKYVSYSIFLFWDKKAEKEAECNFTWPSSLVGKYTYVHLKIWLLYVGFLSPKHIMSFLSPKHIMSNMILKHFCKKDQIKFWSCCQEFKSFTKYIILFYYFHLNLILLSVAYKWFCCDSKQKQFSEKTETFALPSSSLLYLFSFSLSPS